MERFSASHRESPTNGAATLSPPQRRKPWTNATGMSFVPISDIHLAALRRAFATSEAFVQATHYDAEAE